MIVGSTSAKLQICHKQEIDQICPLDLIFLDLHFLRNSVHMYLDSCSKKRKTCRGNNIFTQQYERNKSFANWIFFSNPCYKWTIIINFYSVELSFNTVGDFDLFVFFVIYGTMTEIPLAIECQLRFSTLWICRIYLHLNFSTKKDAKEKR